MPNLKEGRAKLFLPHLEAAMNEFEIASKPRRCAFLAQLAHESSQLRYMEEIASGEAYEGRKDLGNVHSGDGRRYKGRGPIQLTGRANYRKYGRLLNLDLEGNPKIAALPENGFRIAGLFWKLNGLNSLADMLTLEGAAVSLGDQAIFGKITKRINGGYNGLSDRLKYFRRAKQVLHADGNPHVSDKPAAPDKSPAGVSPEPDVDLIGAAVGSQKAREAGLKLGPRIVKHVGAAGTFLWAIVEANKVASVLVLLVILAGLAWLIYHNRQKLKPLILKVLK